MTKEEFQLQKAQAIADCVINAATAINKAMIVAYPPKRAFRRKDRKKVRRKRIDRKIAEFNAKHIIPRFTEVTLACIMAQPFPKYPPGVPAIIGEHWPEIIIHENTLQVNNQEQTR